MIKTVAPALRSLLEQFLDYAGVFPPAQLTLEVAVENYLRYRQSEHSWMLRSFVVSAADVERVPSSLDGALAILSESEHPRASSIESKSIVSAKLPVYCEVPASNLSLLDDVKSKQCFGKIRTGGVTADAIPSPADVARFIAACAERRLPFKATAGLHHPIRAEQPLTYADNAPRAVMHGFVNVLMAASFAWHGERDIEPILSETDVSAFRFDEGAHWRGRTLSTQQIKEARTNFIHSVGSCSFDEPVHDLRALGLF